MHSVDTHGLEIAPKLQVAYDGDEVPQQALQASTLFDAVSDTLVKGLKAPLRWRHLGFYPRREVERVVKDFLVGGTVLYLV